MKLQYHKSANAQEAYNHVKNNINEEILSEKFKVSAKIAYNDAAPKITASGKGFDLEVDFTETEAEIKLKLSLVLRPLKGKITKVLEKEFGSIL